MGLDELQKLIRMKLTGHSILARHYHSDYLDVISEQLANYLLVLPCFADLQQASVDDLVNSAIIYLSQPAAMSALLPKQRNVTAFTNNYKFYLQQSFTEIVNKKINSFAVNSRPRSLERKATFRANKKLGKGGTNSVFGGELQGVDGSNTPIVERKRYLDETMSPNNPHVKTVHASLFKEHFAQRYGTFSTESEYIEILELGQRKTIMSFPFTAKEQQLVAYSIADAIEILFKQNLAHTDIKLDNIILTDEGPKLIDFDALVPINKPLKKCDIEYTPKYTPPELLALGKNDEIKNISAAVIWAFGVTLHHLYTGKYPAQKKESSVDVSTKFTTEEALFADTQVDSAIKDVIEKFLDTDPKKRVENFNNRSQFSYFKNFLNNGKPIAQFIVEDRLKYDEEYIFLRNKVEQKTSLIDKLTVYNKAIEARQAETIVLTAEESSAIKKHAAIVIGVEFDGDADAYAEKQYRKDPVSTKLGYYNAYVDENKADYEKKLITAERNGKDARLEFKERKRNQIINQFKKDILNLKKENWLELAFGYGTLYESIRSKYQYTEIDVKIPTPLQWKEQSKSLINLKNFKKSEKNIAKDCKEKLQELIKKYYIEDNALLQQIALQSMLSHIYNFPSYDKFDNLLNLESAVLAQIEILKGNNPLATAKFKLEGANNSGILEATKEAMVEVGKTYSQVPAYTEWLKHSTRYYQAPLGLFSQTEKKRSAETKKIDKLVKDLNDASLTNEQRVEKLVNLIKGCDAWFTKKNKKSMRINSMRMLQDVAIIELSRLIESLPEIQLINSAGNELKQPRKAIHISMSDKDHKKTEQKLLNLSSLFGSVRSKARSIFGKTKHTRKKDEIILDPLNSNKSTPL